MKQNNIKICNYIIENGIKLLKKNKVSKVNVLLLNNLINIELDNNYYLIIAIVIIKVINRTTIAATYFCLLCT